MKIMHFPKIYNTYFLAIIATLGGALFGFDISSMSAIVGIPQYLEYFDNPAGVLQGGINASLAGGSVVGAIFAGWVSNKLGRKWAIFIACCWWLVGTLLQVTTKSVGQLIVGRLLNGICVGLTSSQVPVYLAEIAKKEKRGSIICIQQLAIEFGILIMYFASYGCGFIPGPNAFRAAWAVQWIPMVFLVIGLPFLPESPRWLIKVGRFEEGLNVIANVQAGGNRDDPLVIAEVDEIKTVLNAERAAKAAGWKKYVSNGMWKRTFAGVSVQAWQQLSGANIITYYVVYIFLMANLTGNTGLIASGAQYAVFIIGTGITFVFIDFTGRRPLLIWGAIGMAICHFVVGGVLGAYGHRVPPGSVGDNNNVVWSVNTAPQAGYVVIAFSYILVLVYALTLAPVAWIYAAEVWSLETRASGMGFATIGNWLFNFALGFFIPPAFRNIQWKIFIVFGVLCLGAAAQAWFSYPETCRKSLEEIEDMFRPGGPKPWQTKKGHSVLDQKIDEVAVAQRKGSQVYIDTEKGGAVFNDDVVSDFGPKGSWALVTGASDGIGKEYATQLAAKGFNILLVSRTDSKLQAIAQELQSKYGIQTKAYAMDFSRNDNVDFENLRSIIKDLEVSILINNVGQSHSIPVPFLETPAKEMNDIITINCFGTLKVTQLVAPGMVERGHGLILTMASFGGIMPTPLLATYSGSKAFLQQWSSALASELAPSGVKVQLVQSYLVTSAMSKIRRSSMAVPTTRAFVKAALGKIGRSGGAQGTIGTSTPYWAHGVMHWAIATFVGTMNPLVVWINKDMHESIRKRALIKAKREAKKVS